MKPIMLLMSMAGCVCCVAPQHIGGTRLDLSGWVPPAQRAAEVRVFIASLCTLQKACDKFLAIEPPRYWTPELQAAWKDYRGALKATGSDLPRLKTVAQRVADGDHSPEALEEMLKAQQSLDAHRRAMDASQTNVQLAIDRYYGVDSQAGLPSTAKASVGRGVAAAVAPPIDHLIRRLQQRFAADRDAILAETQRAQEMLARKGRYLSEYQIMSAADTAITELSYHEVLALLVTTL